MVAPCLLRACLRPALRSCLLALLLLALCTDCQGFFGGRKKDPEMPPGQGRKVVFIFSKARSANSITSRLFEHNEHFIHFHEPFSAWRSRHANERSLHTDVDFLERLVECQLSSEEVYNVVTQGTVVPEQLRQQRLTSTQAAKDLRSLCEGRNVAIKTVRMSSLRSICELQKRLRAKGDEVYVIDTYRDPRAVVANLLDSGHEALSSIPTAQKVKKLSESACQHMTARFKADHRECKGLQTYSLQNEHFAEDPLHEGKQLYGFLKLDMPAEVAADLQATVGPGQPAGAAGEAAATEVLQDEGAEKGPGLAPKQWYDVMTTAQGAEVQKVCMRLMPRALYNMVFVAHH